MLIGKWKLYIPVTIIMALFTFWITGCGGDETLTKENDQLKKDNAQIKKENAQLKDEIAKIKKDGSHPAAATTLRKDIDQGTKELDEMKARLKDAEDKKEEQAKILQKANSDIEFMQGELQKINEDKENVNQEKDQLKLENEHLAMDLENARKEANQARSEIDKLKTDIVKLQEAYANYAGGLRSQAATEAMNAMKMKSDNQQFYAQEIARLRTKLKEETDKKKEEKKPEVKKDTNEQLTNGLKKDLAGEQASGDVDIHSYKDKIFISIPNDIMFNLGEHKLKKGAEDVLHKIGNQLKKYPNRSIIVEGHTDDVPLSKKGKKLYGSNWELSTLRATEVVHFLIDKYNITPKRIMAGGRSKYDPVAPNDNEKNRAKNRRVRIIIGPFDPDGNQIFAEKYNGKFSKQTASENTDKTGADEVYGVTEKGIDPSTKSSKLKTKDDKVITDEGEKRTKDNEEVEVYGSDEM